MEYLGHENLKSSNASVSTFDIEQIETYYGFKLPVLACPKQHGLKD